MVCHVVKYIPLVFGSNPFAAIYFPCKLFSVSLNKVIAIRKPLPLTGNQSTRARCQEQKYNDTMMNHLFRLLGGIGRHYTCMREQEFHQTLFSFISAACKEKYHPERCKQTFNSCKLLLTIKHSLQRSTPCDCVFPMCVCAEDKVTHCSLSASDR